MGAAASQSSKPDFRIQRGDDVGQPKLSIVAAAASNRPPTVTKAKRTAADAALVEAGRKSLAGAKAVLERCNTMLRETLSEMRSVASLAQHTGARASFARLDSLAVALVMLAINNSRELAALASATQREALDVLVDRLQDDLKEYKAARSRRG